MRHTAPTTAAFLLAFALPLGAETKKAIGAIELARNAAECSQVESGSKKYPGFSVTKVGVVSDGLRVTVSATLKNRPAPIGTTVLDLYFDTDNNPKTGVAAGNPESPGWEFQGDVESCVRYKDGEACAGGLNEPVVGYFGAGTLDRYKGKSWMEREKVVDPMGMFERKKAMQTPIVGTVVQATFDYADLKVKPGQTIRMRIHEECGSMAADSGYFPEVQLTLK